MDRLAIEFACLFAPMPRLSARTLAVCKLASSRLMLEFLSDDEVELASSAVAAAEHLVETITPVYTHQTDHRQEDADTHTGRTLHVEGIELLYVCPCITAFGKCQGVDLRGGFEHHGVAQLERHARVGVAFISVGGQRAVFITAEADGLCGVGAGVARHAVTTHIEGLKRGFLVLVVVAEQTEFHTRHEHRTLRRAVQGGEGTCFEFPLVVFHPLVFLLHVVLVGFRAG